MKASVIIRSKNEEAWLGACLFALSHQKALDCPHVVLVDNMSTDATVKIAERFGATVLSISDADFGYSRALNIGIEAAKEPVAAFLSAHCVPRGDYWLRFLCGSFSHNAVAGVYGRQEPTPETSDVDKRDLWTTFGIEPRVQKMDPFFHNANSAIRRDIWQLFPFDESINGVEDRVWARDVLSEGFTIVYEPRATVSHYHGIHQGRDEKRAKRVVRILELSVV